MEQLMNTLLQLLSASLATDTMPPNARPLFPNVTSESVEGFVYKIASQLVERGQPELAVLFGNTFPRTLDTGIAFLDDRQAAISTGDIPAMWIRDSVNQVLHLVPFMEDPVVERVLCGVVGRLSECILIDPFANAFNFDMSANSPEHSSDHTLMQPGVFERKFELDSWASYLQIVNEIGSSCTEHKEVMEKAVASILEKAQKFQRLDVSEYSFQRGSDQPSETLRDGLIMPAAFTGMVPSAFRPSDDACQLPFHIPANAFFSVQLAKLSTKTVWSQAVRDHAAELGEQIRNGVEIFGKINRGKSNVYAYEVDGFGSALFMDDANLPSLLSLSLMGYLSVDDRVYQNTRALLLSEKTNPWYFTGAVQGIGSPHTGRGRVWPLGLMAQYLTAGDLVEKQIVLTYLKRIGKLNGLFVESVKCTSIHEYTRADFGWANSFFPRVVLDLLEFQ